ncbi:MAG: PLP-dependent aminotransferase family protein [Spirochaetaceae bacterium]|nr:MAG: PLP-dependent aminotransferase family protein [Spirochaetaceae bacterium]
MSKAIPLYQEVAQRLEETIATGVYEPGERLPSIRDIHREFQVSINTAREAYRLLEDRGIVNPRSHSGHFVLRLPPLCDDCSMDFPDPAESIPRDASAGSLTQRVMQDCMRPGWVNLATAEPPAALLPARRLADLTAKELRRQPERAVSYELPPGPEVLRLEIARRLFRGSVSVSPDQILITAGCLEAVFLSLMTVCSPGDSVVIESPGFFLFYQLLEKLRLQAIEIPSRPSTGVDPEDLDQILTDAERRRQRGVGPKVAAAVLIANFSNPIGSLIPIERKRRIAAVLERHEVILVEDDMYGEMAWNVERPPSLASFTDPNRTLLCASFSKSIAPGYRVGWIATGPTLIGPVTHSKLVTSAAVVIPTSLGIAAFLANGGHERWLRSARRHYRESVSQVRRAVLESFPQGTQMTNPAGGMVIWIVLPPQINVTEVYEQVRREQICFAPGPMFTLSGNYRNCMRVNATKWDSTVEAAIKAIGSAACRTADRTGP